MGILDDVLPGPIKKALKKLAKKTAAVFLDGEKQLQSQSSFNEYRLPIYLRNIVNTGELFIVSRPNHLSQTKNLGFHTIEFNSENGFFWRGDFYDDELPAESVILKQVLTNADQLLSFINIVRTDEPHLSGVRVYRTDWNRSPGVEFISQLDAGQNIVAMGNVGHTTFLFSEDRKVYIYNPVPFNPEQLIYNSRDLPSFFGPVKRAVVLSHTTFLVEEVTNNESRLWLLLESFPGYSNYRVPSAPTANALGDRHKCLCWYIGGQFACGLWALLVITGTDEWLRIYFHPGIGNEFHLMKYRTPEGKFNEEYTFPDRTKDWDVKLKSDQGLSTLYLIAAEARGGILYGTFDLMLDPAKQYYYEVRSQRSSSDKYFSCVFWAGDLYPHSYLVNPRFEITRDGLLGFRASRMPTFT